MTAPPADRNPRVGLSIMCGTFPGAAAILDLIVQLERTRAACAFVTESSNEAMTLAAAAAARTTTIPLGTSIVVAPIRHPWELAQATINLSHLAPGRFTLGIGSGHVGTNVDRLGLEFGKPVSRMRDYIKVLRDALDAESRTDSVTDHYRNVGPRPTWRADGPVPVVLAALGRPMVMMAGAMADGIITSLARRAAIPVLRQWMTEGALAAGRDPSRLKVYTVLHTVIRPSRDEARSVLREGLGYSRMPLYQKEFQRQGLEVPGGVPDDAAMDQIALAGTEAEVRDGLAAWLEVADTVLLADTYNEPDPTGAYLRLASLAG